MTATKKKPFPSNILWLSDRFLGALLQPLSNHPLQESPECSINVRLPVVSDIKYGSVEGQSVVSLRPSNPIFLESFVLTSHCSVSQCIRAAMLAPVSISSG